MYRLLIVEDEENMRTGLKDNFEFEGYEVELAADGEEGEKKILNNKYDLIILDVMLPKKSGFEVCKEVRSHGVSTPIIHLTAKGEEIDKVLGLEIGADDYITKPFSLRELLARVKAILRRTSSNEAPDSQFIIIGKLKINFKTYNAFNEDKDVNMSHKEFDILQFMWKNRNQTVSRDALMENIWGPDVITTARTIDNFILKLRQKIEKDSANPQYIITVHGIGYKLINIK